MNNKTNIIGRKINKTTFAVTTVVAAIALLSSCSYHKKHQTTQDCSAIFETRDTKASKLIDKGSQKNSDNKSGKSTLTTECKVLEIRPDKNTKCEFVGSNKIDNLSEALSNDSGDKIILITPQSQLDNLGKMAEKYLASTGFDIKKHFDTDVFKSFNFAYKGMRCEFANKEVVIWSGNKKLILSIKNN